MKNIILIGNICSGKTTLSKELQKKLSDYQLISIDDYRKKYNPYGLKSREYYVYEYMMYDIEQSRKIIYESTGASKKFPEILQKVKRQKLIIKLLCSQQTCLARYQQRTEKKIFPYKLKIENSLAYIEQKLLSIKADLEFNTEKESIENIVNQIMSYLSK